MAYFLAGCALLVLLLLAGRQFAYANPSKLVGAMRKTAGIAVLAAAGFLLVRGALPLAIPLAVFGLSLMGRGGWFGLGGPFASSRRTPGQKSDVRTDRLEMQLDHDSGQMDGTCFRGRFAGRALSTLCDREAMELLAELHHEGAPEAALMEAYLDWRLPGWRDAAQASATGRAKTTRMSAEEAYAVLGIVTDASEEEIRQAHRRLMMKMHPDQGGSTYLAARINEAKEVLLRRK